jgi:hypothetical protein
MNDVTARDAAESLFNRLITAWDLGDHRDPTLEEIIILVRGANAGGWPDAEELFGNYGEIIERHLRAFSDVLERPKTFTDGNQLWAHIEDEPPPAPSEASQPADAIQSARSS